MVGHACREALYTTLRIYNTALHIRYTTLYTPSLCAEMDCPHGHTLTHGRTDGQFAIVVPLCDHRHAVPARYSIPLSLLQLIAQHKTPAPDETLSEVSSSELHSADRRSPPHRFAHCHELPRPLSRADAPRSACTATAARAHKAATESTSSWPHHSHHMNMGGFHFAMPRRS